MDREFLIGIEVTQREIKGGIVDLNGKVVKKIIIPTEAKKGKKQVIDNIILAINKLKKEEILGVGIALSGQMDRKKGIVIDLPEILGFKTVALKQVIFDATHIPVFLEHTANCVAVSEQKITYQRKPKHLVTLTLDTTVRAGLILNGKLYHGATDSAGEFGIKNHIGEKCKCKTKGCNGAHATKSAVIAHYKKLSKKEKTLSEISELAKKDKRAKEVLSLAGEHLGYVLSEIINTINPEVILLCGELAKIEYVLETAKKVVEKNTIEFAAKRVSITISELEDAEILGATSIVMSGEND